MSLDISLYYERVKTVRCSTCECEIPISRTTEVVFEANITHNLRRMADVAGFYGPLWRPEEQAPPIRHARELAPALEEGLRRLRAEPLLFKAYDSLSGWGAYDDFLPWLERLLAACHEHPDAEIQVCR